MARPRNIRLTAQDIDALGRIIQAEAGNQPDAGKVGVLFTILNRVASPGQFRDSIREVIEQPNQFEPLRGKKSVFDLPAPSDATSLLVTSSLAALANGELADPTNGATFFQNVAITNQRGTNFAATEPTAVIGDHSFYNRYKLNPSVTPDPFQISMDDSQSGGPATPAPFGPASSASSSPPSFASSATADLMPHAGNPLFAYAQALGADTPLLYSTDSGSTFSSSPASTDASSPASSPDDASPSSSSDDASPASFSSAALPSTQGQYGLVAGHKNVNLAGLDPAAVSAASAAANTFGSNLVLNSAHRTQAHQDRIRHSGDPNRPTVAKNSMHTQGHAIDISTRGMSDADKARLADSLAAAGFNAFGHYGTHIHADMRASVPNSFGKNNSNWGGWTNLPEPMMRALRARGFAPGAPASSIRRGY